jgi:hypothetical protein
VVGVRARIDLTETGGPAPLGNVSAPLAPCAGSFPVWTSTLNDGTSWTSDCGGWATTSGGAALGNFNREQLWSNDCSAPGVCAYTAALYCFEQ